MKKIYIIILLSFMAIITGCTSIENINTVNNDLDDTIVGFVFEETEYNFGTIKQSGWKVEHKFNFTYQWEEPIKIIGIPTSCACTSADIDKTNLNPWDSAILTVKFNPNLHEEPEWVFFKTVVILTEPKLEKQPEIKIWAQIDLDLGPQAYELQGNHDEENEKEGEWLISYSTLTPEQFDVILKNKDFILIDVHIPEEEHIINTDLFIPYNDIERYEDQLPKNKNAKIVLYCRSGTMSRAAAYILAEHGYTNVYDLIWGKESYDTYLNNN